MLNDERDCDDSDLVISTPIPIIPMPLPISFAPFPNALRDGLSFIGTGTGVMKLGLSGTDFDFGDDVNVGEEDLKGTEKPGIWTDIEVDSRECEWGWEASACCAGSLWCTCACVRVCCWRSRALSIARKELMYTGNEEMREEVSVRCWGKEERAGRNTDVW